jgi:hypothetical protein
MQRIALEPRPATLLGLHDAIEERLARGRRAFPLMETKTERRAPTVVDGWLPPKKGRRDAGRGAFPVPHRAPGDRSRQRAGRRRERDAVVEVVIGTYSDTDDGWLDVALIIDAIRADLGAAPTIDGTASSTPARSPGRSPRSSRGRSGSGPSPRTGLPRPRGSRRATRRRAEWATASSRRSAHRRQAARADQRRPAGLRRHRADQLGRPDQRQQGEAVLHARRVRGGLRPALDDFDSGRCTRRRRRTSRSTRSRRSCASTSSTRRTTRTWRARPSRTSSSTAGAAAGLRRPRRGAARRPQEHRSWSRRRHRPRRSASDYTLAFDDDGFLVVTRVSRRQHRRERRHHSSTSTTSTRRA